MSDLNKAIEVAAIAHRESAPRKDGSPYILHPLRVMLRLVGEDERIVAALHDVVEDTSTTLEELRRMGFSDNVLSGVDAITRRRGEGYDDYIDRVMTNPLAVKVKIADLDDNMNVKELPTLDADALRRLAKYHNAWKKISG